MIVLVAVVAVAVVGRVTSSEPASPPAPSAAVAVAFAGAGIAEATPRRTPLAEIDPNARPTVVPFAPYPIPIPPPRREHGTDGLMGRLPFDLPPDPAPERVDRFTIDDVVVASGSRVRDDPAVGPPDPCAHQLSGRSVPAMMWVRQLPVRGRG